MMNAAIENRTARESSPMSPAAIIMPMAKHSSDMVPIIVNRSLDGFTTLDTAIDMMKEGSLKIDPFADNAKGSRSVRLC